MRSSGSGVASVTPPLTLRSEISLPCAVSSKSSAKLVPSCAFTVNRMSIFSDAREVCALLEPPGLLVLLESPIVNSMRLPAVASFTAKLDNKGVSVIPPVPAELLLWTGPNV